MDTSNQRDGAAALAQEWNNLDAAPPMGLFLSQRRFAWIPVFTGFFLLLLGYGLFLMPQTFQSSVSISMQNGQSSGIGSLLGLGGSSGSKSYQGVIKSRSAAQFVARRVHIREKLNLPTDEAAVNLVQESIKVEDIAVDGLMYIRVSLAGPPLMRGTPERARILRETAAQIANAYPEAIRNYMTRSDTDKDLSLLRAAQTQLLTFRKEYGDANNALIAYIRRNARQPAQGIAMATGSAVSSAMQRGDNSSVATQLQRLYEARAQLEQKKAYLDAEIGNTKKMLQSGTKTLTEIPAEDEVLNEARFNYNTARTTLETLRITFGDTNPTVVNARERLKLAEGRLRVELRAILDGKTSAETKQKALDAELDLTRRQIAEVESALRGGLEKSLDYERLRKEQDLRFEALKQGVVQYSNLSLQTVSVQNRLAVVDEAQIPKTSKVPMKQLLLLDLLGAGFGALAYMGFAYLRWSRNVTFGAKHHNAASPGAA